jgi:hypothetical protein
MAPPKTPRDVETICGSSFQTGGYGRVGEAGALDAQPGANKLEWPAV